MIIWNIVTPERLYFLLLSLSQSREVRDPSSNQNPPLLMTINRRALWLVKHANYFYIADTTRKVCQQTDTLREWNMKNRKNIDGNVWHKDRKRPEFPIFVFDEPVKKLGSGAKIRVGRVTGNTQFFFLGLCWNYWDYFIVNGFILVFQILCFLDTTKVFLGNTFLKLNVWK